jgi:hypothetical protein
MAAAYGMSCCWQSLDVDVCGHYSSWALRLGRCSWPRCARDLTISHQSSCLRRQRSGEAAGLPCRLQRVDEAHQRYRFFVCGRVVSHCRSAHWQGRVWWGGIMAEAPLDAHHASPKRRGGQSARAGGLRLYRAAQLVLGWFGAGMDSSRRSCWTCCSGRRSN